MRRINKAKVSMKEKQAAPSSSSKFSPKRLILIAFASLFGLGAIGVLVLVFALAMAYPNLPALDTITDYRPKMPLRIFTADNVLIGEFGEERRTFVRIEDVPESMKNAVLAAEDDADAVTREVVQAVRRTFVTPFDRGDIQTLIGRMDDTVDQMKKAAKAIVLFEMTEFDPELRRMGDAIERCAGLLRGTNDDEAGFFGEAWWSRLIEERHADDDPVGLLDAIHGAMASAREELGSSAHARAHTRYRGAGA